jgi:predicted RND superfamily exporter protein
MRKVIVLFVIAIFASSIVSAQQPDAKKETKKTVVINKSNKIDTCVVVKKTGNTGNQKATVVKKDKTTIPVVDTVSENRQTKSKTKKVNNGHKRHYINSLWR